MENTINELLYSGDSELINTIDKMESELYKLKKKVKKAFGFIHDTHLITCDSWNGVLVDLNKKSNNVAKLISVSVDTDIWLSCRTNSHDNTPIIVKSNTVLYIHMIYYNQHDKCINIRSSGDFLVYELGMHNDCNMTIKYTFDGDEYQTTINDMILNINTENSKKLNKCHIH